MAVNQAPIWLPWQHRPGYPTDRQSRGKAHTLSSAQRPLLPPHPPSQRSWATVSPGMRVGAPSMLIPPKSWLPMPLLSSALPQAAGSISAQNSPPLPQNNPQLWPGPRGVNTCSPPFPVAAYPQPLLCSLRPTTARLLPLGTPGSCSLLKPSRAAPCPSVWGG